MDFAEGNLDGTVSAFMHRMDGTSGVDQDGYDSSASYGEWHIAVIEWTRAACTFVLDGTTLGSSTSRIRSTPMLDGNPPPDTLTCDVEVDSVAVYVPS
jgi:hypothetical protein